MHSCLQDVIASTNTTTAKTDQSLTISLIGQAQDSLAAGGYTQYTLANTLGKLSINSADAYAIDQTSAKTHGTYYKLTGNISRTQFLSPALSINASLNGQWTNLPCPLALYQPMTTKTWTKNKVWVRVSYRF